jgi:hypothetical protein
VYWNTVTPLLRETLEFMNEDPAFRSFRLVGGTSLSLQLGHRKSEDIDMFTDADYDSIDFEAIHSYFKSRYSYVETKTVGIIGVGVSYFVGHNEDQLVKVDVYYTDPFIRPLIQEEKIRMSSLEDIIAMKLDIIGRRGRKKDFWDLHELQTYFEIPSMLDLYSERYPYGHTSSEVRAGLVNFSAADDDFDPICLLGKHWELIKLDFTRWLQGVQ